MDDLAAIRIDDKLDIAGVSSAEQKTSFLARGNRAASQLQGHGSIKVVAILKLVGAVHIGFLLPAYSTPLHPDGMAFEPESASPLDSLWQEYARVFRDWDDLTLGRWLAQTLGQLEGRAWRLSHPLVGAYRLAAKIGEDWSG